MKQRKKLPFGSQRGSALLVTIIIATMILTMAGLMVPLSLRSFTSAKQNHYQTNAYFLAESGLEEGIYALKTYKNDAEWTAGGWRESADGLRWLKTFTVTSTSFGVNGSQVGSFDVFMDRSASGIGLPEVEICSRGQLLNAETGAVEGERTIVVKIRMLSPFGAEDFGGRLYLSLSGRPEFDSWWSNRYPFVYHSDYATAEARVGSPSNAEGSVNLSNGTVNGDVLSGAADPLGEGALKMQNNAEVTGEIIANYERDYFDVEAPSTYGFKTSFQP